MERRSLEEVVTNIDARLARVEQILPTLATKEEIKTLATKEELKLLATKEDLKALATKKELEAFATKEELREEGRQTRRHFDVVAERLEGQIRLVAEGQVALREQMDMRFDGVGKELTQLDRRVMRLEVSRRP
jgi:hypothetical protein